MQKLIAGILLASSLAGCSGVPMGAPEQDAALKKFTIAPGKAGVFVYRNETKGEGRKMAVEIDGRPVGATIAQTYLYQEVTPGRHTVTSKAENTDTLAFEARAGQLHYVWQQMKMGIERDRAKLSLADEPAGQQGVRESRLVESQAAESP